MHDVSVRMVIDKVSTGVKGIRGSEGIGAALRLGPFPATRQEIVARVSGQTLDFGGTRAPLADIVRGLPLARFRDADQAQRAVTARLEGIARSIQVIEDAERAEK